MPDLCGEALDAACALVARAQRPIVNPPGAVRGTGRLANAARLRGLPGVIVPRMAAVPRRLLDGADAAAAAVLAAGLSFPLLARPPGFHTGRYFVRAETPDELAAAAAQCPAEAMALIEPLDARDRHGHFRKYRVMIVDGRLYPLHLAISRHWKVHYFTADMADRPDHREEDAAFLAEMEVIGDKAIVALGRIAAALGLDYGGIDFAVNADGEVLFFEANATMIVTQPVRDAKWDYRRPAVEAVLDAVRAMLAARAAQGRCGASTTGNVAKN